VRDKALGDHLRRIRQLEWNGGEGKHDKVHYQVDDGAENRSAKQIVVADVRLVGQNR
jgi:hypothetical protein